MADTDPKLTDPERSAKLREAAYIIPLTLGRARIIVDAFDHPGTYLEFEFW